MSKFLIILTVIIATMTSSANPNFVCETSEPSEFIFGPIRSSNFDQLITGAKDKYYWLYEELMPANSKMKVKESEKSFFVHFLDSLSFYPGLDDLLELKIPGGSPQSFEIEGTLKYVKIFKKKYRYRVNINKAGDIRLKVKVHFKGATEMDLMRMREKFKKAEDLWNLGKPALVKYSYRFQFVVVDEVRESHFSVQLVDKTRGPYDTQWSRNWSFKTVSHELGHMLGLGDEYKTLSGEIDCLKNSFMCRSYTGQHFKFHYYHVLRRLLDEGARRGQFERMSFDVHTKRKRSVK